MDADYIVVRNGVVVQEISAIAAVNATAAQIEQGVLYVLVRDDDYGARQVDALLAEVAA